MITNKYQAKNIVYVKELCFKLIKDIDKRVYGLIYSFDEIDKIKKTNLKIIYNANEKMIQDFLKQPGKNIAEKNLEIEIITLFNLKG